MVGTACLSPLRGWLAFWKLFQGQRARFAHTRPWLPYAAPSALVCLSLKVRAASHHAAPSTLV